MWTSPTHLIAVKLAVHITKWVDHDRRQQKTLKQVIKYILLLSSNVQDNGKGVNGLNTVAVMVRAASGSRDCNQQ